MKGRAVLCAIGLAVLPGAPVRAETGGAPCASQDPGVAHMLSLLRARERELERRERDLAAREQSLDALEAEARRNLEQIELLHTALTESLVEFDEARGERVGKLAKVYSTMPPARAAVLLEQLDVDVATRVVERMRHKSSAAVLAAMSEPFALQITRRSVDPLGESPAEDRRYR